MPGRGRGLGRRKVSKVKARDLYGSQSSRPSKVKKDILQWKKRRSRRAERAMRRETRGDREELR